MDMDNETYRKCRPVSKDYTELKEARKVKSITPDDAMIFSWSTLYMDFWSWFVKQPGSPVIFPPSLKVHDGEFPGVDDDSGYYTAGEINQVWARRKYGEVYNALCPIHITIHLYENAVIQSIHDKVPHPPEEFGYVSAMHTMIHELCHYLRMYNGWSDWEKHPDEDIGELRLMFDNELGLVKDEIRTEKMARGLLWSYLASGYHTFETGLSPITGSPYDRLLRRKNDLYAIYKDSYDVSCYEIEKGPTMFSKLNAITESQFKQAVKRLERHQKKRHSKFVFQP